MDSRLIEEQCPLIAGVANTPEDGASSNTQRTPNHARDVHMLSFSFFFIFLAYGSAQNLESTVLTVDDLGTTSLGILYLSFMLFSMVGSPLVKRLGSKTALVLGSTGYWVFIASNLKPCWYTMIPASLYVGFASAIIWVGQGTYITCAARSHAKASHLCEDKIIGKFNGEFWGLYGGTQVIGNLATLVLLGDGKVGENNSGSTLLFGVFLGSSTVGIVLMCFLSERDEEKEVVSEPSSLFSSFILRLLKSSLYPLLDKNMLLIIPFLIYSGLEKAFVWSEYTKHVVSPALGVPGIGGAMAIYGAFCAMGSLVAGHFTSDRLSITLVVSCGAILQMVVLLWLLFKYSLTGGVLGAFYPLLMAALWGTGDGVFNTQLNALLGILFRHDMESAFAQLKIWQCASTSVVFFFSPHTTFQITLILMVAAICIFMPAFLFLNFSAEEASAVEPITTCI